MNKPTNLSDSESYLWQYINNHLNDIPKLSIVTLSELANVSTATVVRTMKKMGFEGYTAFKHTLKFANRDEVISMDIADSEIKKAINKNKIEVLNTIANLNSDVIEDTIQTIQSAERILIFARGFSVWIAKEMSIKFQLLDKYSELHDDPNIIKIRSESIKKEDIVIFISLGGETEELVVAAKNCQKNGVHTITLTTNEHSRLAQLSDTLFIGHKSSQTYIPEYEVHSRLPLSIISRIIIDAYVIRMSSSK
ncbi:MurR/RpiR family transcriptional regulator [Vagococcus elongatus]|uniref:RpiR family transcriptional regulator n=1 Tax=Vagococcus elongatus TaxID=180344 RepID=A0A430ARP1_9ENTE|nr:MurR/RpiR family transcriptional regulator [Vagococcus elongatus]RSU10720.1 RpiR family transcriptional regulator [Vagococcus elongatus]